MSGTRFDSRGFAAIGLWNPKSSANVGSAIRAVACFGAKLIAVQGQRYTRSGTDAAQAVRHLPLIQTDDLRSVIPFDCVPVAVEMVDWARPLDAYAHPERAFYVFGPEDRSLPSTVLRWCRDVVVLPTNGCLNLAATVNCVLYDRRAKQLRREAAMRRMSA